MAESRLCGSALCALRIESGGNSFGAVVTGVRLGALADGEWRAIEDAFHRCAVLVFPVVRINEEERLAFARRFGARGSWTADGGR